jgi:uncharacterized protein (TIGR03032 family)
MSDTPASADASPAVEPLRSLHTSTFPQILDELGISLLVTTYQAGKLVALRSDNGVLNTHFRSFTKPMGLALRGPQLAIGTQHEVWEYHANNAVAVRMEPVGKCDMCFMPRVGHVTGNMQIHEMEWVGDELWFVNTMFSCLAVRSIQYSFLPKWQPPFITALAPEDRCHLNGLGLRDGQIRYVTALGHSDKPNGWRERKKDGGILMDVTTNEILVEGLSMPHSPRWYNDQLWALESGAGTIGVVDIASKKYRPIGEVPGFSRGLDFCGPVAFIGLSQVRESAIFSGIPITERTQERICGVWAVDIRSGQTLGWVKFEDAVQEIFAVRVVPGVKWPDLVNHDNDLLDGSFVLPDADLTRVPAGYRSSGSN